MIEINKLYNQSFFSKFLEEGFFCINILKEYLMKFPEKSKEILGSKDYNPISHQNYKLVNELFNQLSPNEVKYLKEYDSKNETFFSSNIIKDKINHTFGRNSPRSPKGYQNLYSDLSKVLNTFNYEENSQENFFYKSIFEKHLLSETKSGESDNLTSEKYFSLIFYNFLYENPNYIQKFIDNNNSDTNSKKIYQYFIQNININKKDWYYEYTKNLKKKYGYSKQDLHNENLDRIYEATWRLDIKVIKKDEFFETVYIYDKDRVKIIPITSLGDFEKFLIEDTDKNSLFFRGQSDSNYLFHPSIIRNKNILKNENKIYEESLVRNPEEYLNIYQTHLDILKKMQHYNVPTRLMDITDNLLVGLFFAIESNDEKDGELIVLQKKTEDLKYTRSDNVSILCSLPPFSQQEKNEIFNLAHSIHPDSDYKDIEELNRATEELNKHPIIKRLHHEVTSEKAFEPEIRPDTFYKDLFVIPKRDNRRIIQQSGSFIICTLNINIHSSINKSRLKDNKKIKQIFVIPSKAKNDLKDSLSMFGINNSTIYPEIEKVADFLKEKYSRI